MARLVSGNAGEGAQTGQNRIVGLGAKVRRRGKAGSWGWAQKCAGVARLVGGNAGEGAQTGQSRILGLGAKVGLGARVCSSESIGAYRNQSESIGGARLSSDLF